MYANLVNSTQVWVSSELNNESNKITKSSGLYAQLAYTTPDCVKRFGFGVAAAGIGMSLTSAVLNIAHFVGYFQDFKDASCKLKPMMQNPYHGGAIGVVFPIIEELLFRGLIQDVILTRLPKYVVKKIQPGSEIALDTKIAKAFRIILTAALFSAIHISNDKILPDSYVKIQLIATFIGGISFGVLKESKPGMTGAMGAHIANNVATIAETLYRC